MGLELEDNSPQVFNYTEQFYKAFPFYLSIGMTYEQYWLDDCTLPKYYREAYKMQEERTNTIAWLQGSYIYDALCAVSPILHAFAKNGTKPQPYHKKPYSFNTCESESKIEPKGTVNVDVAKFHAFAAQFNAQFKGGETDAEHRRDTN